MADRQSTEELIRRFKAAKEMRANWDDLWRDAYDYSIPHKQEFITRTKGEVRTRQVYDSTAVEGVPTFATRLIKALVPSWGSWAKIVPGEMMDPDEKIDPAILGEFAAQFEEANTLAEVLEGMTEIVFSYIHQSNFQSQAFESFQDLAISCGALLCEYDTRDVLRFTAVPLIELYLEHGPRKTYETVWRYHEIPTWHVERLWPDATISTTMQDEITNNPDKKRFFIEGTVYEEDEAGNINYRYVVIDEKEKDLIWEQDFGESSPWIVFPWSRSPSEIYGRGPVIRVMPDILSANKMKEFILQGAAWKVFGLFTARDDGVWNPFNIKLRPGTLIPVGSNTNDNPTIRPLDVGGDLSFTDWALSDLQRSIQEALFANPLGEVEDTPVRTLGENMMRMREMLERSGASFGLLETEFVFRVMQRVVYILQENGLLPNNIKVDGKAVTLKMQSPIAQARDAQELDSLMQFYRSVMPFGEDQIPVMMDLDKVYEFVSKKTGIPSDLLRDEEERDQIVEEAKALATQQGPQLGTVTPEGEVQ